MRGARHRIQLEQVGDTQDTGERPEQTTWEARHVDVHTPMRYVTVTGGPFGNLLDPGPYLGKLPAFAADLPVAPGRSLRIPSTTTFPASTV